MVQRTICSGKLHEQGLVFVCSKGVLVQVGSDDPQQIHAHLPHAGLRVLQPLGPPQGVDAPYHQGGSSRPSWQALDAKQICMAWQGCSRDLSLQLGVVQ